MNQAPVEIVIPREKAVFWLDRNGRWRNDAGLFRNSRIIEHFHSAIRRDAGGYYLSQEREGISEKVYFPYEDTALFVVDVKTGDPAELILNTRRRLPLDPAGLLVENDALYTVAGDERIRFTDRALLKMADLLEFEEEGYFIRLGKGRLRIREKSDSGLK
ncbi:MAG: MFS transporter permease [Desulfobacterales bacterium]